LRASESDEDEEFCRQLCQQLNVECRVYRAGLTSKVSEANLRATRYGFLYECAQKCASTVILTAHTQDDQVETVLFRLFRGTSTSGFTGIKAVRKLNNGLLLVRPMLNNTRAEVNELLAKLRVVARADSSNRQTKFARNFLRNGVIIHSG
jgi:tRNA(Ile)-lysidine synthetase-like protein